MMQRVWLAILEPLLRHWPTYPPDWQRRRMLVFERAMGRCEACGLPAGAIALREDDWRVTRAHVHHIIPLRAGGRHGLANLRLLCLACHRDEHPGNSRLGA